jgi:hypothetical protein
MIVKSIFSQGNSFFPAEFYQVQPPTFETFHHRHQSKGIIFEAFHESQVAKPGKTNAFLSS